MDERRFGVVLAARWPFTSVEPFPGAPWPERTLDVAIAHPVRGLRVLAIYAPLGRHDTTKSETFEAAGRLDRAHDRAARSSPATSMRRGGKGRTRRVGPC